MTTGDELRRIMEDRGVTIVELSEESGVARSTISRMLRSGEGMLYSWRAVARALGVKVSELIGE